MPLRSSDCIETRSAVAALSGGVDSAVAAMLAQQMGLRVIGVTLGIPGGAAEQASRVCRRLGIEHHVVDVGELFDERVIGPFCVAWAEGITPNPCVECNACLKLAELLRIADDLRCDAVVTGHYARVRPAGDEYHLLRGIDRAKDQSYMLYRVEQHALARLLLPLGEPTKRQVRRLAAEADLQADEHPESQDVCFAPGGDVAALVASRCPEAVRPGPILDREGNVLGEHDGLARYTVGQRRGLGLGGPEGPFFVLHKLPERNALVVGPEEHLMVEKCELKRVHLVGSPPGEAFRASVMTRYRGRETPATVHLRGERATVLFERPHRAPAPGQSAVFYEPGGAAERVIGGGVILPLDADEQR
ncbi:MAG: tRNA 2-thiouridine(34) synthase MnmA [Armatimonadota bacterium]